jgi:hypothetical protein
MSWVIAAFGSVIVSVGLYCVRMGNLRKELQAELKTKAKMQKS